MVLRRNEHTLTSPWFPPGISQLSSRWSYEAGDYSISVSLSLVSFRSLDTKPVAGDPQGHAGLAPSPSCPRRPLLPQKVTPTGCGCCLDPALPWSPLLRASLPLSLLLIPAQEEDPWPGRPHTCYPPSCWCSWPQVRTGDKGRGKEPRRR